MNTGGEGDRVRGGPQGLGGFSWWWGLTLGCFPCCLSPLPGIFPTGGRGRCIPFLCGHVLVVTGGAGRGRGHVSRARMCPWLGQWHRSHSGTWQPGVVQYGV